MPVLPPDRIAHNKAINASVVTTNRLEGRSARAARKPAIRVPCPLLPPADPELVREMLDDKDIAPPIAPGDDSVTPDLVLQPWNSHH
eukprot:12403810-Karenia_brevis.AAC.1